MHPDAMAVKEAALSVTFLFPVAGREYSQVCVHGREELNVNQGRLQRALTKRKTLNVKNHGFVLAGVDGRAPFNMEIQD